MPVAGDSAPEDSAPGDSAPAPRGTTTDGGVGDSAAAARVKPHSVTPREAGTQEAPQDRLSRPAHRSSRPHRNVPPLTADATAQLNHQEVARHQAAPPPGILNFFNNLFH
jgi:hypothetical protein